MPALTRSSLTSYRLVGYEAEWHVSIDSTDGSVSQTREHARMQTSFISELSGPSCDEIPSRGLQVRGHNLMEPERQILA